MATMKIIIPIVFSLIVCVLYGKGQEPDLPGDFNNNLLRCQGNSFFLPNLPDFYFDEKNAASFSSGGNPNLTVSQEGITYIFTPDTTCVVALPKAVEYCYDNGGTTNTRIFDVLFIQRHRESVEVMRRLSISTMDGSECINNTCCGISIIPTTESSIDFNLMYGVRTFQESPKLLRFNTTNKDNYHLPQYHFASDQDMYSLSRGEFIFEGPLLLMRYLIENRRGLINVSDGKVVNIPKNLTDDSDNNSTRDQNSTTANERGSNGVAVAATVPTVLLLLLLLLLLTIVTILFVLRSKRLAKLSSPNPPGIENYPSHNIVTPVNQAYGSSSASTRQGIYTLNQAYNTSQDLNIRFKQKGASSTAVPITDNPLPLLSFQQAHDDFDTGYVIEDEELYSAGNALYDEIPNLLNHAVHATQNSPAEPPAYQHKDYEARPNIATFTATSGNSQKLPHSLHEDSQGKIVSDTERDQAGDKAEDEAVEQEEAAGKGEGVMKENVEEEQEEVATEA